jgi:HSP20 family protein
MTTTFADPFDTLFRLQRELEARRASDWLEDTTSGMGAFPPINVFQQGHDRGYRGATWRAADLDCKRKRAPSDSGRNPSTSDKVSTHRRERRRHL